MFWFFVCVCFILFNYFYSWEGRLQGWRADMDELENERDCKIPKKSIKNILILKRLEIKNRTHGTRILYQGGGRGVCLHVICVPMFVTEGTYPTACMWRSEGTLRDRPCLPLFRNRTFYYHVGQGSWPTDFGDSPVSASIYHKTMGLQTHTTVPSFYVGCGHSNSGLHDFTANSLHIKPSLQPDNAF